MPARLPRQIDVQTTSGRFKRFGFAASFKATLRTDTVDGGWEQGKEGKVMRRRDQPGRTDAREEDRQLKSAKEGKKGGGVLEITVRGVDT